MNSKQLSTLKTNSDKTFFISDSNLSTNFFDFGKFEFPIFLTLREKKLIKSMIKLRHRKIDYHFN